MSMRFLPAALVAVVLALVVAGGAALAFGRGGADREATDDLLERTATELGLEAQQVKDALAQARSDIADERIAETLAELVQDEVITQAQADEAKAWLDRRPAVADLADDGDLLLLLATSGAADIVLHSAPVYAPFFGDDVTEKMAEILGVETEALEEAMGKARAGQESDERDRVIDELIAQLVEDGEITEAEGQQIKSWLDEMPEWLADHHLLFEIFAHGMIGSVHSFATEAFPNFDEYEWEPFETRPYRMIPELEELKRDGFPFFFGPDGHSFDFPGFEFDFHDDEPGRRFFFHGPEGEFEFDGQVPPEFEELFESFEDRFGGDFDFENLDELLESFGGFHPFSVPAIPDDDEPAEAAEKGA